MILYEVFGQDNPRLLGGVGVCDDSYTFYIKRFNSSTDNDYRRALVIYNNATPPEIKTDPREIDFWVDGHGHSEEREMLFFGLYLNNSIIGFAETAFLRKNRIMVVDYISLDPEYRKNSVFFPFFSLIESYFNSTERLLSYIITEINDHSNGELIDKESRFFRKMLLFEDFQIIDAPYYQPNLFVGRKECMIKCKLLIRSAETIRVLQKTIYMALVDEIYYTHYFSWFEPFLTDEEKVIYKNKLGELLIKISNDTHNEIALQSRSTVRIEKVDAENDEKTSGSLPENSTNETRGLKIGVFMCIVFLAITVILLTVLEKTGLHENMYIFWANVSLVFCMVISIVALFSDKAKSIVGVWAKMLSKFFC